MLELASEKMPPDVTQPRRTQNGVGDGVQQHVGIRMAKQAHAVVDGHAANHQPAARH